MAYYGDFVFPEKIGNVSLPDPQTLGGATDLTEAENTARLLDEALRPQRMITPAVTIEEGNQITREISVSSAQTADAVVKYVYGRKLAMPDACVSCRVGNGVFRRCVVLDAISPGCANCQYGCRSHTYAKAPDFPASEKADVDVLVNALADVPMKAVQQSCVLLAQAVNITVVSRGGEDITASNLSADMREAFGFTLLKAVGYLVALGPDDVTTGRFTFGHVCRSHKCSAAPGMATVPVKIIAMVGLALLGPTGESELEVDAEQ
ncbi:hypothetical protein O9K51_02726 [Purpureocillium lavendulum]|uniref:Uncharacterized protein n=1 Tax=Purpureocillium lavendulum TaxID=1247861 RepID=A0AB34G0X1_9HYPO|nr:hypothetical protein O9K51_02726 [Purpureocillium lavendulum]